MPHQCVRCNKFYDDGSQEIIKGCPCGGHLFFYIKKEKLDQAKKEINLRLSAEEKEQVEQDVLELIGEEARDTPVVLDFESIRLLKPGKYELDLVRLFKGEPVIFKLEDGKYVIDLGETFTRMRKK